MLNHPVCCIHPSKCCVITCSVSRPVSWDYPLASPVVTLGWECQGGHRTEDKPDLYDEFPVFPPDRIVSLWSIRGTMAFCRVDTWGRGQGREDQTVMMENREEARLVMVENQEEACCAMVDN